MDAATREALVAALKSGISKKQINENVPMSRYTTLHLGGPAECLCEIAAAEQLSFALKTAAELHVPITLLGNGSNLLVRDGGLRGLVIHLGDLYAEVSAPVPLPDGRFALTAQAGATLQKLCNTAADYALCGLEFASGIPGTVGGAVYMNAGAYGGEIKDVLSGITTCDEGGRTAAYTNEELQFGYRTSLLATQNRIEAVSTITVSLAQGDEETIRATMREFSARRREKQPINMPSCGSTFKRPEGQFAGTLIESAGLKGFRIGGVCVSEKHAGFLINDEDGTAEDYLALIAHVQRTVQEQAGVLLLPEVRILGEESPIVRV
ncbi:MAG: UDP-N-acetylmuramate dehydrogenase [Clostridia bacterium]